MRPITFDNSLSILSEHVPNSSHVLSILLIICARPSDVSSRSQPSPSWSKYLGRDVKLAGTWPNTKVHVDVEVRGLGAHNLPAFPR